jgi:hypothetical protein
MMGKLLFSNVGREHEGSTFRRSETARAGLGSNLDFGTNEVFAHRK